MTYHYYLWCTHCKSHSPEPVLVSFNGMLRKNDYGLGGRQEMQAASSWFEQHEGHGKLELLHQDDSRLLDLDDASPPTKELTFAEYRESRGLADSSQDALGLHQDEIVSPLEQELTTLLNGHCCENNSNTPDFILARYLLNCLDAFNHASNRREDWYGKSLSIGGT